MTSARIIFNYAVRLLKIVIAFETTRSAALLVEPPANPRKVPEEESDPARSSRKALHPPSSFRNLAKVIMKRFLRRAPRAVN